MCWGTLISGGIGAMVGALGAFGCAYYAANKNIELNRENDEKKMLSDLYYVVTQLSGFINYFQYACKMNSAFTVQDYQNILNKITCVDKNILDISQPFFYNSNFEEIVRLKLCKFIESYIGWKGYGALLPAEKLVEYILINEMEINAVDCLNAIGTKNSHSKDLVNYIDLVACARDSIKNGCLKTNKSMEIIVRNLMLLLEDTLFCELLKKQIDDPTVNFKDVKEKIVCQCFKYIHGDYSFTIKNSDAGKTLFYKEIKSLRFLNEGVFLVDNEDKQYEISGILNYMYDLYKGANNMDK